MENQTIPCKALVLAGGGARGSYQVGVWKALMELDWHPQIITGTSVGSLNGAMFVLDLYEVARDMWLTIRSKDVMELPEENADLSALHSFLRSVVKAGGMDVSPLEEIVERVLDEDALRREVATTIVFGGAASVAAFLLGFSGLSVCAQAQSLLAPAGLGLGRYLPAKLLHGALSALLALLLSALHLLPEAAAAGAFPASLPLLPLILPGWLLLGIICLRFRKLSSGNSAQKRV